MDRTRAENLIRTVARDPDRLSELTSLYGGHMSNHVGSSAPQQLDTMFRGQKYYQGMFRTPAEMEHAISTVLQEQAGRIAEWLDMTQQTLAVDYDMGRNADGGRRYSSLYRSPSESLPWGLGIGGTDTVTVILERQEGSRCGFCVKTAYPNGNGKFRDDVDRGPFGNVSLPSAVRQTETYRAMPREKGEERLAGGGWLGPATTVEDERGNAAYTVTISKETADSLKADALQKLKREYDRFLDTGILPKSQYPHRIPNVPLPSNNSRHFTYEERSGWTANDTGRKATKRQKSELDRWFAREHGAEFIAKCERELGVDYEQDVQHVKKATPEPKRSDLKKIEFAPMLGDRLDDLTRQAGKTTTFVKKKFVWDRPGGAETEPTWIDVAAGKPAKPVECAECKTEWKRQKWFADNGCPTTLDRSDRQNGTRHEEKKPEEKAGRQEPEKAPDRERSTGPSRPAESREPAEESGAARSAAGETRRSEARDEQRAHDAPQGQGEAEQVARGQEEALYPRQGEHYRHKDTMYVREGYHWMQNGTVRVPDSMGREIFQDWREHPERRFGPETDAKPIDELEAPQEAPVLTMSFSPRRGDIVTVGTTTLIWSDQWRDEMGNRVSPALQQRANEKWGADLVEKMAAQMGDRLGHVGDRNEAENAKTKTRDTRQADPKREPAKDPDEKRPGAMRTRQAR